MNSPEVYNLSNTGSRINSSFVSPIHGIDRRSINTSLFTVAFTPLKNTALQRKLDECVCVIKSDGLVKQEPTDCQLYVDVTPLKPKMSQNTPKSRQRRRQSLLVFEALDNISSVSKTPTTVKIRHSTAFFGSATKVRVESDVQQQQQSPRRQKRTTIKMPPPTATSTEELTQLLQETMKNMGIGPSLLKGSEADDDAADISLESIGADDYAVMSAVIAERNQNSLVPSTTTPQKSFALYTSESCEELSESLPVRRDLGNNSKTLELVQDENTPQNLRKQKVTATPTRRESKRFENVMLSCSKVLQDIDMMLGQ